MAARSPMLASRNLAAEARRRKPAPSGDGADHGRSTASRRRSRTCCPGRIPCRAQRRMQLEDGQSVALPSSSSRWAPKGREMYGWARAMRWRTRCRTRSTNSTTTPGWSGSAPRMNRTGTATGGRAGELRAAAPRAAPGEVLSAVLRAPPRASPKTRRPVRGHDGDASWRRPVPARAHGGHIGAPNAAQRSAAANRPSRRWRRSATGSPGSPMRSQDRRMAAADIHDWLLRWFQSTAPRRCRPHRRRPRTLLRALTRYPMKSGRRRNRTGKRFAQPVLRPTALGRANGNYFIRRPAASVIKHGPSAHAAVRRPYHRRDAQGRRRGQRAVRPDAGRHGDVPDAGRHAAGRARGAPEPPEQEVGRRDARLGADPAGRNRRVA